LQSPIEAEYEKRLHAFDIMGKYPYEAIRYTIGWLNWKEKLVRSVLIKYIEIWFLIRVNNTFWKNRLADVVWSWVGFSMAFKTFYQVDSEN
jgi:hypothetical protein